MAKDKWLAQTDNWDTPSDWSLGLPDSSSNVLIRGPRGRPEVTASFGTVNSITNLGTLTFIDAGASSVVRGVTNSGRFYLDPDEGQGGSSLTIGSKLTNSFRIDIGNGRLSAASTVEAAAIVNGAFGTIHLSGSKTAEATLDVGSSAGFGAAGLLTGYVSLAGDALIEFKSGQITTIAGNLTLNGSHAFIADASDMSSNSALTGLKSVAGRLDLEGAATVTTSRVLTNSGTISANGTSLLAGREPHQRRRDRRRRARPERVRDDLAPLDQRRHDRCRGRAP